MSDFFLLLILVGLIAFGLSLRNAPTLRTSRVALAYMQVERPAESDEDEA